MTTSEKSQIDAVYTWVNHRDPTWQALYGQASKNEKIIEGEHDSARSGARFYSRDELYYSIKSLRKYAPWIRTIYIVSNCARPAWLDDFDDIQYVLHQAIFPNPAALPTFNSKAIESVLHRIDGLSERFLYLNDDFFLCQIMHPDDFFWGDEGIYFFPSKHDIPYSLEPSKLRPVDQGAINSSRLLTKRFGQTPKKKLQHAPYALSKSMLMEIENYYSLEMRVTRSHPFRHPEDIAMTTTLHAYYAFYTGRGKPREINTRYIDIGDPLFLLLVHPWSPLMRGKYATLCLNEVASIPHFAKARDWVVCRLMKRLFD